MDPQNQQADNANGPAPQAPPQPAQQPHPRVIIPRAPQAINPAPKRQRNSTFRNPGPPPNAANAMLEAIERLSLRDLSRPRVNTFVPSAIHMYHVLGICDQLMNTCEQFTSSTAAWIPIVSQLYISILWLFQILNVYVNSGHGFHFAQTLDYLSTHLRIQDCPVPGPLVPFFQSLSAVNGPFEWIADITPRFPDFHDLWSPEFYVRSNFARLIPIPAVLLDQLHCFANWQVPADETLFDNFLWYNDIFGQIPQDQAALAHIGPQMAASLHTTEDQLSNAQDVWHDVLARGITRTDAEDIPFDDFLQLFGFQSQHSRHQIDWFETIITVMQRYCMHFSHSTPLSSIQTTGLGAVTVYAIPNEDTITRDWIYPPDEIIQTFATSRVEPPHAIPDDLRFYFTHADHKLEALAEQHAMLSHINLLLANQPATQHDWEQLDYDATHSGDYWRIPFFRASPSSSLSEHMAAAVSEDFFLPEANYED